MIRPSGVFRYHLFSEGLFREIQQSCPVLIIRNNDKSPKKTAHNITIYVLFGWFTLKYDHSVLRLAYFYV